MAEKYKGLTYFSNWVRSGLPSAVQAIREFTGLKSEFSEPEIAIKRVEELCEYVEQEPSICLLQTLNGGIEGYLLFAVSSDLAKSLVNSMSQKISSTYPISENLLCQSLIAEWANIFSGNFVSSLKEKEITHLAPIEQTYDMSGSALDFIACQMGLDHQMIATGNTRISFENIHGSIQVWIIVSS